MKLAVKCDSLSLAKILIDKGVNILYFGINNFSCRFNKYINLLELKKIVKIKKNTKISILLNNLYAENEINDLENLLEKLSKIDIDEICFHDFGVLQIIYEKKIKIKCHYNPETLNTNYGQLDFFKKNNINKISLAKELSFNELKEILNNKKDMEIEIQAHGFTFFMHSKWPMITNFQKYLLTKNQKINNFNYLVIQEEKRKLPNLIYEDKTGTHMFSGFTLCTYDLLIEFWNLKLDSILIETIFRNDDWTKKVVDIYLEAINNIKKEIFNLNKLDQLKDLEKYFLISKSFLGDFRKMPHMEKEDYEN